MISDGRNCVFKFFEVGFLEILEYQYFASSDQSQNQLLYFVCCKIQYLAGIQRAQIPPKGLNKNLSTEPTEWNIVVGLLHGIILVLHNVPAGID